MPKKPSRQNWVAIVGSVEAMPDGVRFSPPPPPDGLVGTPPVALAKTDILFRGGDVSFTTHLNRRDDRVQLVLNHGQPTQVFVGLNTSLYAFGILVSNKGQWESLAFAGTADSLQLGRDYHIRVRVVGSQIALFVDGVDVCRAAYYIQKSQLALFLTGWDTLRVTEFSVTAQKPTIFVVMQYTDEFDALYEEVLRPVCEDEFHYHTVRAKDRYTTNLVIEDITRQIQEAEIVIADITPDNSNVFYEVGYSHGLNKPTILLSDRKRASLPFNIAGFRTLFYDNTIGGKSAVEARLREHLRELNTLL